MKEDSQFNDACHKMWEKQAVFITSCPTLETLPPLKYPEIAFLGRSNVGKSSLINSITRQKGLAKASNTPGRTQLLNFFLLDSFYLVDMPGYGYAKAPKTMVDSWQILIKNYLRGRSTLKRLYLLIDSRHGLKANDIDMMGWLDAAAVSYQLVLTKTDKISKAALISTIETVSCLSSKHPAAYPVVLSTSTETKEGIQILKEAITDLLTKDSH